MKKRETVAHRAMIAHLIANTYSEIKIFQLHAIFSGERAKTETCINQRTNGPVNAHLISGPSKEMTLTFNTHMPS